MPLSELEKDSESVWAKIFVNKVSDMGFTAHQHKKAISRRIRYIK